MTSGPVLMGKTRGKFIGTSERIAGDVGEAGSIWDSAEAESRQGFGSREDLVPGRCTGGGYVGEEYLYGDRNMRSLPETQGGMACRRP